MNKLTDKLPIETWQNIAYFVQGLEFSNCSWQEFEKNVNELKNLVKSVGIYPHSGIKYPHHKKEIGVSTLLQAIYDTYDSKEGKNKTLFYEQIYALSNLGIQELEYCPIPFYTQVMDMTKEYYDKQGITIYDKAFTDGTFELETYSIISKGKRVSYYDMVNLQNANFILNILLEKQENSTEEKKIILREASASLKNFKGKLPCKEEILNDSFPTIMLPQQLTIFNGKISKLKETYIPFNSADLSYTRRLVKEKN